MTLWALSRTYATSRIDDVAAGLALPALCSDVATESNWPTGARLFSYFADE